MAEYERALSGSSAYLVAESSSQLEELDWNHLDPEANAVKTGMRDMAIEASATPKTVLLAFEDRFDDFGELLDIDTFLRDMVSGSETVHVSPHDDSEYLGPSTAEYKASVSSNEDRSSFDIQRELASVENVSCKTSNSNELENYYGVDIFDNTFTFERLPALFTNIPPNPFSLRGSRTNDRFVEFTDKNFRDYRKLRTSPEKGSSEQSTVFQKPLKECNQKRRYSEIGTPQPPSAALDDMTIPDYSEDDEEDAVVSELGPVSPSGLVLLNSVTKQMDISSFELSLLKFFTENCINFFSFDKNPTVDYVWRNEVPRMFMTSRLVRNSILSFSALNMWPLGLLNFGVNRNLDDKVSNLSEVSRHMEGFKEELPGRLYERTISYFQESIAETSDILIQESNPEMRTQNYVSVANNLEKSLEFFVSSVLTFSFLGMHPHGLVPLVSFSTPRETDFLSMASSMHLMCMMIGGVLFYSPFRGLLYSNELSISLQSVLRSKFPVVEQLRKDIDNFREATRQDPHVCKKLYEAVNHLQTAIYKCVDLDYPVPLFRYLVELDSDFITLIRQQNAFALKILFAYLCLCLISRFQMSNDANIFLGYIQWYREHNASLYSCDAPTTVPDDLEADKWFFKSDAYLYYVVVIDKYLIQDKNFRLLASFDPELLYRASQGEI